MKIRRITLEVEVPWNAEYETASTTKQLDGESVLKVLRCGIRWNMGLFKWLKGLVNLNPKLTGVIPDHIKEQRHAPYYCGIAFCAHSTKRAAALCWQKHCVAWDALQADLEKALKIGGYDAYIALYNQRVASVFPRRSHKLAY